MAKFVFYNGLWDVLIKFDKKETTKISLDYLLQQKIKQSGKKINGMKKFAKYWIKNKENDFSKEELLFSIFNSSIKGVTGAKEINLYLPISGKYLNAKSYDELKNNKDVFLDSYRIKDSYSNGYIIANSLVNFIEWVKEEDFNWKLKKNDKTLFYELISFIWGANSINLNTESTKVGEYINNIFNGFNTEEKSDFWGMVFNNWKELIVDNNSVMASIRVKEHTGFSNDQFKFLSEFLDMTIKENNKLNKEIFNNNFSVMIDCLREFKIFGDDIKKLLYIKVFSDINNSDIENKRVNKI